MNNFPTIAEMLKAQEEAEADKLTFWQWVGGVTCCFLLFFGVYLFCIVMDVIING